MGLNIIDINFFIQRLQPFLSLSRIYVFFTFYIFLGVFCIYDLKHAWFESDFEYRIFRASLATRRQLGGPGAWSHVRIQSLPRARADLADNPLQHGYVTDRPMSIAVRTFWYFSLISDLVR